MSLPSGRIRYKRTRCRRAATVALLRFGRGSVRVGLSGTFKLGLNRAAPTRRPLVDASGKFAPLAEDVAPQGPCVPLTVLRATTISWTPAETCEIELGCLKGILQASLHNAVFPARVLPGPPLLPVRYTCSQHDMYSQVIRRPTSTKGRPANLTNSFVRAASGRPMLPASACWPRTPGPSPRRHPRRPSPRLDNQGDGRPVGPSWQSVGTPEAPRPIPVAESKTVPYGRSLRFPAGRSASKQMMMR